MRRARTTSLLTIVTLLGTLRLAAAQQATAPTAEQLHLQQTQQRAQLERLRKRLDDLERHQRARQRREADRQAEQANKLRALETSNSQLRERLDASLEREVARRKADNKRRERLRLYGWADFAFVTLPGLDEDHAVYGYLAAGSAGYFIVGHINLIVEARPWTSWRLMFEPRFTHAPDGDITAYEIPGLSSFERVSTAVVDTATQTGLVHWGGVSIERAWIAWEPRDWFNILIGSYLTPYGIWNIDHGAPALISARTPLLVSLMLLPPRLTGIKLYGATYIKEARLEYALHVSNGRTPLANTDENWNKALGGRLALLWQGLGKLKLGASFFLGRYTDHTLAIDSSGSAVVPPILPPVTKRNTTAFDEYDLAFDLSWDLGPFGLRAEAAVSVIKFDDDARPTSMLNPGFNLALGEGFQPLADYRVWDAYATLIFRPPWRGLSSYLRIEWTDPNNHVAYDNVLSFTGGLNWRIAPPLVAKLEYQGGFFVNDLDPAAHDARSLALARDIHVLTSQLAVSF